MISEEITWAQWGPTVKRSRFGVHFIGVVVAAEATLPAFTVLAEVVTPSRQNDCFRNIALRLKQSSNYVGRTTLGIIQVGLEFVCFLATFVGCFRLPDEPTPDLWRPGIFVLKVFKSDLAFKRHPGGLIVTLPNALSQWPLVVFPQIGHVIIISMLGHVVRPVE